MSKRLSPYFIQVIYEAALRSFWYKNDLRNFLRRVGVPGNVIAQLNPGGAKRDWLDEVFSSLEPTDSGQQLLLRMAHSLAEQRSFPALANLENSTDLITLARQAIVTLRAAVESLNEDAEAEREAAVVRQRAEEERAKKLRSTLDLGQLKDRLDSLCMTALGTANGGYDFEQWFYDLMEFSEVDHRRPYKSPDGRQIDGSITVDGFTYLVELKFTKSTSEVDDIDSFLRKVTQKADNTMGVMVSLSGFNDGAKKNASGERSPLLLLDAQHLYSLILCGAMSFADVVRRVRRHSSQEGEAYLSPAAFSG